MVVVVGLSVWALLESVGFDVVYIILNKEKTIWSKLLAGFSLHLPRTQSKATIH
jgi:hypothetical protein